MPWSFIIPAAASLIGGSMQASATKDAANAANAQNQAALDLQKRMYEEGVARQQPFLQGGTEDYNRLRALMSGGPQAAQNFLTMDPGYGFRLAEGQKALDRRLAAGGRMFGGGALKAGQQYAQDQASQEFGNAYNRLAGLAQIGPSAAGVMNTLGQNYATGASNTYGQMGQNTGNALLARGSTYGNMLGDIGQLYGRTKPNFGGLFGGGSSIGNTGLEGMSPNDLSYFFGG